MIPIFLTLKFLTMIAPNNIISVKCVEVEYNPVLKLLRLWKHSCYRMWFSARIFAKSDMISFLSDDFKSSKVSVWSQGDLLVPAMRMSSLEWFSPDSGVPRLAETSSSIAFLFWLLFVIFREREERYSLAKAEFVKSKKMHFFNERFCGTI